MDTGNGNGNYALSLVIISISTFANHSAVNFANFIGRQWTCECYFEIGNLVSDQNWEFYGSVNETRNEKKYNLHKALSLY